MQWLKKKWERDSENEREGVNESEEERLNKESSLNKYFDLTGVQHILYMNF